MGLRRATVSLQGSGTGFSLTISGIPVYACDGCGTSLVFYDDWRTVDEIVTAVIDALDSLAPAAFGSPHTSRQCAKCKTNLPREIDKRKARFTANARMQPTGELIGVVFQGDSLTCPTCARRYPCITPATYHEIAQTVRRAASLYARG
jgi:hypothetical protein